MKKKNQLQQQHITINQSVCYTGLYRLTVDQLQNNQLKIKKKINVLYFVMVSLGT